MALFKAVVVVELPALRPPTINSTTNSTTNNTNTKPGTKNIVPPRFVVILPHGDAAQLPRNVLEFCFPDLDQLANRPFHYDHSVDEFIFTLTPKDEPHVYGFCRRYRVGTPSVNGRLDLTPYTSANLDDASAAPAFQCICILSERYVVLFLLFNIICFQNGAFKCIYPSLFIFHYFLSSSRPYHRFFGHCLQLLHAARLAGGPVALKLARMLIGFSAAPPGAILPLRSLMSAAQIPGSLQFPREKLRVPTSVGLPYFDVPLAPLLNRLDVDALLMLYTAMLAERRIMFVAQAIPTLTSCVHAAIALLQPFEWQNIFIPVRFSFFSLIVSVSFIISSTCIYYLFF
jgi:DENN (AEX-3) domain/uDENN domain